MPVILSIDYNHYLIASKKDATAIITALAGCIKLDRDYKEHKEVFFSGLSANGNRPKDNHARPAFALQTSRRGRIDRAARSPRSKTVGLHTRRCQVSAQATPISRWKLPVAEMPDSEITVLIRLKDEAWPIVLGFRDEDQWMDVHAGEIDSEVLGWMHLEDAAKILDFGAVIEKGGAK